MSVLPATMVTHPRTEAKAAAVVLGGIGSPVLRRVVRSFGSTWETLAPSVTDRGSVPVDASGAGSARVGVTSGTLVESRSIGRELWRASAGLPDAGEGVHGSAPASRGAHGRPRCSSTGRRATGHMILRSGRTAKLEAPFSGSRSRAFGSTGGGPGGGETFGGRSVAAAAAEVDAASADEASALPSPAPLPRARGPLRKLVSLTPRKVPLQGGRAVMVRPWPLNHAATSRHA